MSTAHKKSTNKPKSDVIWRWAKSEWENSVPTKKNTPVWIGQGETHCVLLGIGSHVSVCAPGASQSRQLEG